MLRRERLVSLAATRLRESAPKEKRPSTVVAEASVAAAWRIGHADVAAGRTKDLPQIAPLLAYVLLAPVVGADQAVESVRADHRSIEI
jgi:hypothetical protein